MTLAVSVGVLVAGAVYLMLQRGMVRIILGFVLISHAANLTLISAGGAYRRGEPLLPLGRGEAAADPLPQAFVLTAIVIAFSITLYMLSLAVVGRRDRDEAHDDTDDDIGDDEDGGRKQPGDPDELGDDVVASADGTSPNTHGADRVGES